MADGGDGVVLSFPLGYPHGDRPGDTYPSALYGGTPPQAVVSEVDPNEGSISVDPPPTSPRWHILQDAANLVDGDRHKTHGPAELNLGTTGELWTFYSGRKLDAHDVAMMNVLQKISRILCGERIRDHYVDIAGWAALAGELANKD